MSSIKPAKASVFRIAVAVSALAVVVSACTSQSAQDLLASGQVLSEKRDHNAAAIQFKAALQRDPGLVEARMALGKTLLAVGDPVGAATELTKALDSGAPAAEVLPALSKALVMAGEYKKLVAAYGNTELQDKPALAALKTNLATAWGALGDRAQTETAAAAALKADPEYGPARILEARLQAGRRNFDDALATVDALLAKNDQYADAWLLRGELVAVIRNDAKLAEESFRRALSLDRNSVPAHAALITSHLRQRDLAAAKAQAQQMRAVAPNHPYTAVVEAQLAYLDNQPARARELSQQLLRSFPDHPGILLLAGSAEADLGATVQAQAYFGKVVQFNPAMEIARRRLAEMEIRLGQYANALKTLGPLLKAEAPSAAVLSLAGDAELRLGNADAAEQYFRRAAKIDPANLRVQAAVAMTRLWRDDAPVALAELQALSSRTQDTYVDEALFAARLKRREFDAALAVLDVMAKKQPGQAAHQEMRGRVHLARQDPAAARAAFEAALKLDPGLYGAVVKLAFLDVQEGKRQQAIDRLQRTISADPKNWMAMVSLAEMKARNGDSVAEVQKLLADAVATSPLSPEPRLRLIDFNLRKRLFKDALVVAQDALSAFPTDANVLEAVGQAQLQAGDLEQAATTFRRFATAVPDSAVPYLRLGNVYSVAGKRDQAESALRKALEIAPGSMAAQTAYLEILLGTGRRDQAAEHIRRIKTAKPRLSVGYVLEAAYHMRQRNVDAALFSLREGVAKAKDSDVAGRYFSLLHQSGRTGEAEKFGAEWMRQHPRDAGFEYLLSVTDITGGRLQQAESRLKRVVAAYPTNAMALNNMAWVMAKNGSPGASGYAQRAVDLQPDSPVLMDTLAFALAAEGQSGAALDVQRRAVELMPNDNALRFNLAKIALQAGDKGMAKQELLRLQGLGSDFSAQAEVGKLLQAL